MPVGVSAYVALANVTLGSSASTVTFSSINSGYRDLVFILQLGTTSGGQDVNLRINGDTGGNYNGVSAEGWGSSTVQSLSYSGNSSLRLQRSIYTGTGLTLNAVVNFLDYSATDKHKSVIHRLNNTTETTFNQPGTGMYASRWANTAAVTSVEFSGATFIAGSTFALYGIQS
jgi:hypothetical protein